jgi:hypothetical protein
MPRSTLLIIASARDEKARQLATLWEGAGARLLLPRDFTRPGWRYQPGRIETSIASAGGESIPAQQISGVLTRLGNVAEDELIEIVPSDRAYVAQEINAFLVAWLSALRCPILNRPGTVCLSGPNWRPEQWVHAAAQAGIPVIAARRHVPPDGSLSVAPPCAPLATVTIVGKHCFGSKDRCLQDGARRLARCAKVEFLAVTFAGSGKDARFWSANLWPEISAPDLATAIQDYLGGRARGHC